MSVFDIVDVDVDATVASCVCPTPKPKPKRKRQLDGPTRVIGGWEAAGMRSRSWSRSVGWTLKGRPEGGGAIGSVANQRVADAEEVVMI